MRVLRFSLAAAALALLSACLLWGQDLLPTESASPSDGMFIHITAGPEQPHRVLMALQMATLISDSLDVAVYCDIDAVKWLTKDAADLEFSHFPSSETQIKKLIRFARHWLNEYMCFQSIGKPFPADAGVVPETYNLVIAPNG
ncbi:MAG: hypothetical protein ABIJ61_05985, partial [bacterium]